MLIMIATNFVNCFFSSIFQEFINIKIGLFGVVVMDEFQPTWPFQSCCLASAGVRRHAHSLGKSNKITHAIDFPLMPRPSTGPKIFRAGPNFLDWTKN